MMDEAEATQHEEWILSVNRIMVAFFGESCDTSSSEKHVELVDRLTHLTTMPYQHQDCVLYGTVFAENIEDLERRLSGLCDPGCIDFNEHEMVFSLRTGTGPDVTVRLRRKFESASANNMWHFRYIGAPEPDQKCPTIVRKVIDSISCAHDMMEFVKTIGLRMDHEYIAKGKVWTWGRMKITVCQLQKCEKVGNYDASSLKPMSSSYLIEMNVCLPDSADYLPAAKDLRAFADQLMPLVHMEKVEYWKRLPNST